MIPEQPQLDSSAQESNHNASTRGLGSHREKFIELGIYDGVVVSGESVIVKNMVCSCKYKGKMQI